MYSTAPADRARQPLRKSYSFAEKQCILQPQPTGQDNRWGSLTPLQRSNVFYSPSRQGKTTVEEVLLLCREAMYSTAPADRARHPLRKSYSSTEKQLIYSTVPAFLAGNELVILHYPELLNGNLTIKHNLVSKLLFRVSFTAPSCGYN